MKRRLLSLFCALALCLGLLPATALADNGTLTYQYYDTVSGQMTEGTYTGEYTTVTNSDTAWSNGWYVVSGSVSSTRNTTITVSGTVNLILTQGSSLTLNYGRISISSGSTLNIYGQDTGSGTLTLGGYGRSTSSGIGLNGSSALNIHGGTVNATGYCTNATSPAPGIDVGGSGTLTVYDGTVTATGGTASNSIGRGAGIRVISGGTVNIHGGTVTATGASNKSANGYPGAGIGGNGGSSAGETCGTVNIYGGTVTATGGSGGSGASAGIGGGQGGTAGSQGGGGNVTITGGTVTAIGGESTSNVQAPGIGGAVYSSSQGNAGSFSTGTGGSAVITTTGGIQADTSGCSAIIDNTVYGTVTLPDSLKTLNKHLTVPSGATLILPDGTTTKGTITVNGTLTVDSGSTVTNSGTITNNGTLTGGGTIQNTSSGTVTGGTGDVKVTYPSTVEVSSSTSGTAVLGQEVTFTATVTGNDTAGTPTGTVQFKDGETNLGEAVALEDGVATYTANNGLDVGEHPITAEYTPAGDAAYTGSSGSMTFTVVGDVASISVQTQPTTMTYTTGQALDLTGLEITVSYAGSSYTQDITWSADSGITASIENGTTLYASQHDGQTITITYEGKTAQTSALSVSKANQIGFAFTEESPKEVDYSPNGTFTVKAEGGEGTGAVTYTVPNGMDVISIDGNTATILKAGTATITATKAADVDYNEATATLTVTVNSKSLENAQVQVSGEYTYDGNAKEPSGNAVTVTLGDKTLTENEDYTLSYENNTDAGEATVTAAGKGNYSGTATGSFTIAKATLTVTGVTAQGRAYDGSATVTITGVTLGGVIDNDDVSVDTSGLTGTVDSPDVGTYNTLTLSGTVTLTGAAAGNYTLTLPTEPVTVTGGVTISQATASISFNNYAPGKTYDGTALANPTESELTLTGAGYNDVTFTWYEGTSPDGAKLDSAPTDAGTYYLVAFIPDSNNTSASEATSGEITITKATATAAPGALSVSNNVAKTYTYDLSQLLPALDDGKTLGEVTYTLGTVSLGSYYTNGATISGSTLTLPIQAVDSSEEKEIGTVTVTISSGNYADMTGTITVYSVNKLPQTVTISGQPSSVVYGDSFTLSASAPGSGAVTWSASGCASVDSNGKVTITGTGEFTITATVAEDETYAAASNSVTMTAGQKTLTITAENKSAYVGDSAPALTYTVTGLVGSDTLTTASTLSYASTPDMSKAGTVQILASGAEAGDNYDIQYVNGTLTVTTRPIPTYAVTVNGGTGGGSYQAGQSVTVTAGTRSGYTFAGWTAQGVTLSNPASATVTFVMPENDVTLTASWTANSTGGGSSGGGTTPTGPSTGSSNGWSQIENELEESVPGTTVTVDMNGTTEVPAEAFEAVAGKDVTLELDMGGGVSWTVNGQDIPTDLDFTDLDLGVSLNTSDIPVDVINLVTGEKGTVQLSLAHNGEFGFTMTLTAPLGVENKGLWANLYHYNTTLKQMLFETSAQVDASGNVALKFTHASEYAIVLDESSHELPFTDTAKGAWYQGAVEYVYRNGIMTGTSATTFEPNASLSRAMVAQILYNLEGQPAVTEETTFTDSGTHWAVDAITWAQETGVVNGYEDNTFRPNRAVTREELAQMLYNYAKVKGYDLTTSGDLTAFPDGSKVSSWAKEAMAWANGNKLINGFEDDTLRPGGDSTRAQAASILMNFDVNLVEE